MGTKERRLRERQELKQSILRAAQEIAAQEGWQAVTMRKVAELIEYSAPTIYEHFESKEALLYELLREGFRTLHTRLRLAYVSTDDPETRLLKVTAAYCEFAWSHPELYQVMHGQGGTDCHSGNLAPEIHDLASTLMATVEAALGRDDMTQADLYDSLDILRGILHGLVSLTMEKIMAGGRQRAMLLVERGVRDWLAGWRQS